MFISLVLNKIIPCVLFASFCMAFIGCSQTIETDTKAVTGDTAKAEIKDVKPTQPVSVDKNTIIGNWVRTDAPYNLKIADIAGDGKMKAEYYNPKSIHVEKSTWIDENGVIKIYVELRDENYPGSNYTLFYLPDRDLLAGKYFQAVEGVTYDVGFMRAK